MKPFTRRAIAVGAAAGAVGALGFALGPGRKLAANRVRARIDPLLDPLFDLPAGVVRRDVETHDGGSIHVIECGEGRPLVLIHGVTLGAEVWAPIMHLASDRFRVIAIDVRGHGRSVVGFDGVGRNNAARDLATVLETLDLHDAIICGHSMGGMILGQFCGDFPEMLADRVAGLVFMDTAVANLIPPGTAKVIGRLGAGMVRRSDAGRPLRLPSRADDELLFTRMAFGSKPSGKAVEVTRRLGHDVSEDYRTRLWVDLFDTDNRAALDRVDQPALVIVGSRDSLTPIWAAKSIVAHLRHGELKVMAGAGHQMMQERPYEVVEELDRLVTRIDAAS